MQTNTPEQNYYQEDEIDLKELFGILWAKKTLIIGITTLITVLAGIYAFNKTPIYEATALVEIGNYKNNNNNNVLVDSVPELVKKLNLLFIDLLKNEKDKKATIISISTTKGVSGFLDIKSEASSNEWAINEINKVVSHIQNKHQTIMDDVKNRRKLEIKNIQTRINGKNKEAELLTQKINIQQDSISNYQTRLNKITTDIGSISETNPALIARILMDKGDMTHFIDMQKSVLKGLRNQKYILETTTIYDLTEKKRLAELTLLPSNYKNSEIIGGVLINNHPIKPKKKPIVMVAFIAGFILSIFLVFIMNAFRKEEDTATA